MEIPMPILREFEKEFSFMTSRGDMPDAAGNVMPLCSRHMLSVNKGLFATEKLNISLFQRSKSINILLISITSRGPTPNQNQLMG